MFRPVFRLFLPLLLSFVASPQAVAGINVSVAVFDPGVPADTSLQRDLEIFPRIREIEAVILPFALREALAESGDWGAVRVVPEPDLAAELLVTGVIGHSDGEALDLGVRAVDASGRVWLDKTFRGAAGDQRLLATIATALRSARDSLDNGSLRRIPDISLLRYGNRLAPSAFKGYLSHSKNGIYSLERLPARGDPMLERLQRVRETEYVITDAVDARFRELHEEIASVYDIWRRYRQKNLEYQADNAEWASRARPDEPRGSFEALKRLYDNYKYDRIIAQEQDRLAVAFDNEVGPKVGALEQRVRELQVWIDRRYAEWHRILEGLFEVETGIDP